MQDSEAWMGHSKQNNNKIISVEKSKNMWAFVHISVTLWNLYKPNRRGRCDSDVQCNK